MCLIWQTNLDVLLWLILRVNKNPFKTEENFCLNTFFYSHMIKKKKRERGSGGRNKFCSEFLFRVNTSSSFHQLSWLIRRTKSSFIMSWKTQQWILGKKCTSGACVRAWPVCVWRAWCVSLQPSLKSSVSGWIEGSGSDFPRKWEEETRGFRPLRLCWSHKTPPGREPGGWREDRKGQTASHDAISDFDERISWEGKNTWDIKEKGEYSVPGFVFFLWLCGDESSPRSAECSALLFVVLLAHTGSCWEERLPQRQVLFNPTVTLTHFLVSASHWRQRAPVGDRSLWPGFQLLVGQNYCKTVGTFLKVRAGKLFSLKIPYCAHFQIFIMSDSSRLII